MGNFFYHFDRWLTGLIPRTFGRIRTQGQEHVPREGAALLLCNHISHFDPPIMMHKFPRIVHFMADKPLLEIPIVGPLLRLGHVFPIDRTKNDLAAVKTTFNRLKDGNVVGIFAEGGIRHGAISVLGGAELPIGTIALWHKAKVAAIPMVIIGSDQLYEPRDWFFFPRIFVRIGPVIPYDPSATREDLRDRLIAAWKELFAQMQTEYNITENERPHSAHYRWGVPEPAPKLNLKVKI